MLKRIMDDVVGGGEHKHKCFSIERSSCINVENESWVMGETCINVSVLKGKNT